MSTERQIHASRSNRAKSHGPKTPEGKPASPRNAIIHGLLSGTVILEGESIERFRELLAAFHEELEPRTPVESSFVENMAVIRWRQLRVWGMEKATTDYEIRRQTGASETAEDSATIAALAFRALRDNSHSLELLNRYEARFDRRYLRAHRRNPIQFEPDPPAPGGPPTLALKPESANNVLPTFGSCRKDERGSQGNVNVNERTQQVIENRKGRRQRFRDSRSRVRGAVIAFSDMITAFMVNRGISGLALAAALLLASIPAVGQAPAARKPPDLNGIWQALSAANWDLLDHGPQAGTFWQTGSIGAEPGDLGVVEGGEIPYLPAAAAKKKENFANRAKDDPEAKCYMPGIPRAAYMPYPFQIVQSPKDVLFVYEFASANRLVNMGKPVEAGADSWMGTSNGHWEGNTLVVDVTGLNGLSWFDRAGDFATDNLHVVERYTLRDKDHLDYEATIEDPKTFSRPWKIHLPLYRRVEKNMQLVEFKCVPFSEELLYGQYRKQVSK
jgi:hypothetical protein